MLRRVSLLALAAVTSFLFASCAKKRSGEGLKVTYGKSGLETLSFGGTALEDTARYGDDAFHIWHMRMTDAKGKVLTAKEAGWGEFATGKAWDLPNHTWTYSFPWGSIALRYVQDGNTLNLKVTETNNAGSSVILDGATLYPLALHFPDLPKGFVDSSFQHLVVQPNDAPPVADWGDGQVSITTSSTKPLYRGFEPAKGGASFYPVISSTSMDSLPQGFTRIDRPVLPGQTDSFAISLVFKQSSGSE